MITLIFGAGASFGSGGCSPYPPPLANNLFSKLLELKGEFAKLEKPQHQVFVEQGFEAGMTTIENDNHHINPLQKELACYLSKFNVQADNAYVRLLRKIQFFKNEIAIATLNYDLLIEQSLIFNHIAFDYSITEGMVPLLKLHGSSNFLPELGEITFQRVTFAGGGAFIEGLKTNATFNPKEIEDWCNNKKNADICPVLAMFQKDKRVVINSRLIKKIQDDYASYVAKSSHIVIVGIKYLEHDSHVWKPISNSNAEILLVDPYQGAKSEWEHCIKPNRLNFFQKSFDKAVWDIAKFVRQAAC